MSKRNLLRLLLQKKTLKEKLFEVVSDYDIYCAFIGYEMDLGESIRSPIRATDEFPSFRLYIPTKIPNLREEEIWFKDLADGRYGNVFKFVKYFAAHHYNINLVTDYDTILFIDEQLELKLKDTNVIRRSLERRDFEYARRASEIYYKSRKFTDNDLKYWKALEQDIEDLDFWNVKSIKYILDENGYVKREFKRRELAFIYKFFDKVKSYQPEAPRSFKFRNTCPGDDYRYYQGFEQLRGKEAGVNVLIITKSYKDVMVFYKFFNEYLKIPVDVIAPHAESINLSQKFVDGVKENYEHILCVSDYDLAGVKFAQQCKRYEFAYKFISTTRFKINNKLKVIDKDISDFLLNNGKKETLKLLSSWNLQIFYEN